MLVMSDLCGAGEPSTSMAVSPDAEVCGCPPDSDSFEYETYGIVSDAGAPLSLDLQGWTRLGLTLGIAPDSQGYLKKDGQDFDNDWNELKQGIGTIRAYGTHVDVLVDLTGEEKGKECWIGDESSFSVLNLVDQIVEMLRAFQADGVLLKVPISWIVTTDGVSVDDDAGGGTCGDPIVLDENTRRNRRVQNLMYRLREAELFKSSTWGINLFLIGSEESYVSLFQYCEKLPAKVDYVLYELPESSEDSCQFERALLRNACDLELIENKDGKVIPVINKSCLGGGNAISETLFDLALKLGFSGLAMEVTDGSEKAFLSYNKHKLENQGDFFAGIIWKRGLANSLCSKRNLIRWGISLLGGVLTLIFILAVFFCPVRQALSRVPYFLIGAGLLLAGMIWLYEAVNPTKNNLTSEIIVMILVTVCVVFFLGWARNRQRSCFP